MPLVWCLNAQGAKLEDRVYGPCLMRRVLDATPAPWRHFFFGGTPECLAALQAAIVSWGRGCCVAGVLSPPFREWTAVERASFDDQIRTANPDFVWVALGGCRQEQWIVEHAPRFTHGVFLAVGDAFELLAGRRRIASAGLQRMGLTWMYRLVQEPRRLWKRYLVYNTLFVVALLRSGIQKPANRL
jgi:N-acetylglucosaminyldiphosphoundecaprenol N-acetyl-beta-D-mannosaminyltransferase